MKIIHTSDWHLGKKTEGKSRLEEQRLALDELCELAKSAKADAVIAAGDIFDTVNPSAEAEELFYSYCLKLSRTCPVIAVAGNHDNPERLNAPRGIAGECGVLLCGGMDDSRAKEPFCGGEGFVTLRKGTDRVNFALLPYPSSARMSALGYVPDPEKSYAENVREWLAVCARGFTASDCNITVSHLFMEKSERASDEAELGTAALLPLGVLPDAHYTALGHVHKPQCVSKSRSVYYSGSLLRYSFDDTSEKFFNVLNTSAAGVKLEKVRIESGKKLVTVQAESFDEAMRALKENADDYVRILYNSPQPLSAGRYAEMRAEQSFAAFRSVYVSPEIKRAARRLRSDGEYFSDYYKLGHDGEEPPRELLEMFEKAMRGEEL